MKRLIGKLTLLGALAVVLTVTAIAQSQDNVLYAIAKYNNVSALVAAGAAPTRLGVAMVTGQSTAFDGSGRVYMWDSTSTTATNTATSGYSVLAASGVTTGRWLLLETRAGAKLASGIQSGSVTTAADGTVTNTFTVAYAAAPTVLVVQTGEDTTVTNTVTVTATNFLWNAGAPSTVGKWLALP